MKKRIIDGKTHYYSGTFHAVKEGHQTSFIVSPHNGCTIVVVNVGGNETSTIYNSKSNIPCGGDYFLSCNPNGKIQKEWVEFKEEVLSD